MFGLKTTNLNLNLKKIYIYIYIYINLKLIMSKTLNIAFIVTTLLLSHIKVAFQSTSVQQFLSESLSKYKGYEYINVIFVEFIHLF